MLKKFCRVSIKFQKSLPFIADNRTYGAKIQTNIYKSNRNITSQFKEQIFGKNEKNGCNGSGNSKGDDGFGASFGS
ncbi:hypothetical protein BKH46_03805 [Helicobacter sp. 12S02634-8]|uniref:hypothetical protein n=1 Tax=Helicobacter sp. 12S02634-8 TaxID=1476199 RepID=UPI000BD73D7B|nr:hypothetical protein [Helicobacter sp. 12S02634-8]PAF47560.1 hypothetical protein BKH46_03805 [Helicobacter sp. 12S02634-8]